jgi:hypothetical protein
MFAIFNDPFDKIVKRLQIKLIQINNIWMVPNFKVIKQENNNEYFFHFEYFYYDKKMNYFHSGIYVFEMNPFFSNIDFFIKTFGLINRNQIVNNDDKLKFDEYGSNNQICNECIECKTLYVHVIFSNFHVKIFCICNLDGIIENYFIKKKKKKKII